MKIAVAHASKIPGAARAPERGDSTPMPKTIVRISARQSSESISAASAREPTPAIVYENTTSSGVSTSMVCESEPWDRVRSTGLGPEGAVMKGKLTQRQARGKQRTMGPSYLGWIDRQMDEERCEFS